MSDFKFTRLRYQMLLSPASPETYLPRTAETTITTGTQQPTKSNQVYQTINIHGHNMNIDIKLTFDNLIKGH